MGKCASMQHDLDEFFAGFGQNKLQCCCWMDYMLVQQAGWTFVYYLFGIWIPQECSRVGNRSKKHPGQSLPSRNEREMMSCTQGVPAMFGYTSR